VPTSLAWARSMSASPAPEQSQGPAIRFGAAETGGAPEYRIRSCLMAKALVDRLPAEIAELHEGSRRARPGRWFPVSEHRRIAPLQRWTSSSCANLNITGDAGRARIATSNADHPRSLVTSLARTRATGQRRRGASHQ